jgi:hypothetical protein
VVSALAAQLGQLAAPSEPLPAEYAEQDGWGESAEDPADEAGWPSNGGEWTAAQDRGQVETSETEGRP